MSKITIYNLIASHLGQDDQDIDPSDDTRLAAAISGAWDIARKAALRSNNWNFAVSRAAMPALATAPAFEFGYAFPLPGDFIKLVDVVGPMCGSRDWTLEGQMILANTAGPLQIKYVRDVTDVEYWDDQFQMSFSLKVAALIAVKITGDAGLAEHLDKAFMSTVMEAYVADANETPPQQFDEDSWLMARYGGGWGDWGGSYGGSGGYC